MNAGGSRETANHWRACHANLRKPLLRAIAAAGVEPWPRLWHNLRASRQSELSVSYPAHVVCAWIGNTAAVASTQYLQVTEEHFAQATASDAPRAA